MIINCQDCNKEMDVAPHKGLYFISRCQACVEVMKKDYKGHYIAKQGEERKYCSSECAQNKNAY